MKSLFALLITTSLMIGSTQAIPIPSITDCGTLIGYADQSTINSYNGAAGGKLAGWALAQIGDPTLDPSAFSKVNTSNQQVTIGAYDLYIMLHWGNGGNSQPYQLYDVSTCAPGVYHLPSPRRREGGLSWIGRIPGGNGVPDGGTTLIMLGLSLCGLATARKFLARKR